MSTSPALHDAPLMLSVSGCRGIFGQSMTPEVAARFAMVAGAFFRDRAGLKPTDRGTVVLARDGRLAGEILLRAAASGLCAAGCDVLNLDVAMTPTVGVLVDQSRAIGGLVVTASHNPQQWNGLKPVLAGTGPAGRTPDADFAGASAPDKPSADDLIARYKLACTHGARGVNVEHAGRITTAPTGAALDLPSTGAFAHAQRVLTALSSVGIVQDRRWQSLTCVVDSVNSSGVEGARALLGKNLTHHLGSSTSGLFPHPPEPTLDNLTGLARATGEHRANVGFAQDPDADRLALIDENGKYIGEEYTLVLCAMSLLGSGKVPAKDAVICVNLSTSRMIEDVCARFGARVERTAVGEANVVAAMKRHASPIGGEGNGGVIWPKVTYIRDSLGAMGLVLGLMARENKTLSQLVADIPAYAIVKTKVDLSSTDQAPAAVAKIARAYQSEKLDTQDGIRVDFTSKRAWLHVRGSNTEPIMRLIAEAPDEATARSILADANKVIAG